MSCLEKTCIWTTILSVLLAVAGCATPQDPVLYVIKDLRIIAEGDWDTQPPRIHSFSFHSFSPLYATINLDIVSIVETTYL